MAWGRFSILTPAFAFECDCWCRIVGSWHYLGTADADRFVLGVCYPSKDGDSDSTVLALVVVCRHLYLYFLSGKIASSNSADKASGIIDLSLASLSPCVPVLDPLGAAS